MSQGYSCKCPQKRVPIERRRWGVVQRHCRCSAFDGYREMTSDYSAVICLQCGMVWRTKAAFVEALPSVNAAKGQWAFVNPFEDEKRPKIGGAQ